MADNMTDVKMKARLEKWNSAINMFALTQEIDVSAGEKTKSKSYERNIHFLNVIKERVLGLLESNELAEKEDLTELKGQITDSLDAKKNTKLDSFLNHPATKIIGGILLPVLSVIDNKKIMGWLANIKNLGKKKDFEVVQTQDYNGDVI